MSAQVLVTAPLPGPALETLARAHPTVVLPRPEGPTADELDAALVAHRDVEALLPLLTVRVDARVLDALPRLRVVSNFAVGVDNIDVAACRARGVTVCNTPDVLTDATADLAFGLILATMRRISEGERFLRGGHWKAFRPDLLLGHEVTGSTLGIVGFGRIGQAVARRASGFRMRVLCTSPRAVSFPDATRVPLETLLAESDVVSLHCPLTDATRNLIDARALAHMKRTAVLINTSRGPTVDEAALAEALHDGVIAGAGLDVFAHEPAVHPRLLDAPNAVLVPHIGSASHRAREAMARLAVEGVLDVLAGREPAHRV